MLWQVFSSFWLPGPLKDDSQRLFLCLGLVCSKLTHDSLFIEKPKKNRTKIPLSPVFLKIPTGTHPIKWPRTKHLSSKPARLAKLQAVPIATCVPGTAEKYANWQTGHIYYFRAICFIVLWLSSLPRARSTEAASNGPIKAVSISLPLLPSCF
jgi:hypothetical protein